MRTLHTLLGWKRGKARKGTIPAVARLLRVGYSTVAAWARGRKMSLATETMIQQILDSGAPLEFKRLGRPFKRGKKDSPNGKNCLTAPEAVAESRP